MFAFFWVVGALVTLAGLALVATGAIPHDAAFDSGTLTAGTIASVGGLLLIGIGLTVRELRRIEQVIASGRRPRAAHVDEDQATDVAEARSLLEAAAADGLRVVDPYLAPVMLAPDGEVLPANLRERIRQGGPTIDLPVTFGI